MGQNSMPFIGTTEGVVNAKGILKITKPAV